MALTEETLEDKIEVVGDYKAVQIRTATRTTGRTENQRPERSHFLRGIPQRFQRPGYGL